jgi:hypothetical protein
MVMSLSPLSRAFILLVVLAAGLKTNNPRRTALVCLASPLQPHPGLPLLQHEAATGECSFQGNSDAYGLGIRIGVYLQWMASYIANNNKYAKEAIGMLLDTNTIFITSLLSATIVLSHDADNTYALDIAILLYLLWGTTNSIFSISGGRTVLASPDPWHAPFSAVGSIFRIGLSSATTYFSVWFWFSGVHLLQETECGSSIFFFAQVSLLGWGHYVFAAASVLRITELIFQYVGIIPTILIAFMTMASLVVSNVEYLVALLRLRMRRRRRVANMRSAYLPYRQRIWDTLLTFVHNFVTNAQVEWAAQYTPSIRLPSPGTKLPWDSRVTNMIFAFVLWSAPPIAKIVKQDFPSHSV